MSLLFGLKHAHNKAFKRDSCRVAFLVCGDLSGEDGLRKVVLGGIHPLTQRYALIGKMTGVNNESA